jgi:hypothetical protein
MAGDNRTPNKKIGEIKYAEDQANGIGDQPRHDTGAPHEKEDVSASRRQITASGDSVGAR